jgi:CRISPR-associated exonuclease Cas4
MHCGWVPTMIWIAALLLSLALWLWLRASAMQRGAGLPRARARVLYDDAIQGRPLERALVSHRHQLVGRPDFLIEGRDGVVIPVEAKPLRRASRPYAGDLLQLAAYCVLVEETEGIRPPYGILRYAEQSWEVPFDDALEDRLLARLDEMDEAEELGDAARSHEQAGRCAGCGMREHCDERLA